MKPLSLLRLLVAGCVFYPCLRAFPCAAQQLYWTNYSSGKIQRANIDGSQVQDVITGLTNPSGLAVDLPDQVIYWSEIVPGSPTSLIRRANLDGSNIQTLFSAGGAAYDMTFHSPTGKLYWTEYPGKIRRSDPDGSNSQDIIFIDPLDTSGSTGTSGGGFTIFGDKLFYPNQPGNQIFRSALDGSDIQNLNVTGMGGPWGFAADPTDGSLYFIDEDDNRITRIVGALAPSVGLELSFFNLWSFLGSDSFPNGIAINPAIRELYWSEGAGDMIYRLNLDTDIAEPLIPVDGTPRRIVFVPEPSAALVMLFYLAAFLRRRERLP
jgi:sugar lactone lactonase YvrE